MGIKNLFKKRNKDLIIEDKEEKKILEEDICDNSNPLKSKLDDILNTATDNFFPKTGKWYSHCFRRENEVVMGNLPCHLRNSEWLTKLFISDQKLFMFSKKYVLSYVKDSEYFNEARHNYELEIVKWQINYMLNGGEGWICDEEYGGDFIIFSSQCDIGFRKGVVDTLTKIGIDNEVIEEGLEKNAGLWREKYMERAFSNEFDSIFLTFEFDPFGTREKHTDINEPRLEPIEPEFKDAWMKMHLYEYYQRHKDSVDKYGVVLPEMQMSSSEVEELRSLLEKKTFERKQTIKVYQDSKQKVKQYYNNKK